MITIIIVIIIMIVIIIIIIIMIITIITITIIIIEVYYEACVLLLSPIVYVENAIKYAGFRECVKGAAGVSPHHLSLYGFKWFAGALGAGVSAPRIRFSKCIKGEARRQHHVCTALVIYYEKRMQLGYLSTHLAVCSMSVWTVWVYPSSIIMIN